jgi:NTP pyrophosphatase (non-canonical NTP hydrolase)
VACPNFENIYSTYPARQGETIDEKCKRILKYYGPEIEIKKTREELRELCDILLVHLSYLQDDGCFSEFTRGIMEEMADVYVCLLHLKNIFKFSEMTMQEEIERKVNRQLERIKNEQSSN